MLLFLREKELWNNLLSAGANNFADSSYLFIYSMFLFLGGRSGKQLWTTIRFQMDNNLLSNCHSGVPAGKVQGSELSLDMSRLSAAATRQVIMGYKCVHEGCQKSFESRKRYNVHRQRNCGKPYETSSSGAKSFRAARRMLSAQSFISSPMSSRRIKVCNAGFCEKWGCK